MDKIPVGHATDQDGPTSRYHGSSADFRIDAQERETTEPSARSKNFLLIENFLGTFMDMTKFQYGTGGFSCRLEQAFGPWSKVLDSTIFFRSCILDAFLLVGPIKEFLEGSPNPFSSCTLYLVPCTSGHLRGKKRGPVWVEIGHGFSRVSLGFLACIWWVVHGPDWILGFIAVY